MNKKLLYILLALVMVCSVALTACNLTPAKVTITYKYNYEGAPADKTVTLDEGATITLDTPTRTDYKFDGWFTDAACTKAFTDKVANANVTLYAKWTASHTHDLHYQSSSSKHWQECSCGYTTEQVDHTFDANNTCVCGYKQGGTAHTHSWATDWSKDATNHWHVCTGCSELNDKAAHDTSGTDGACSVCGYKAQAQGQAVTVYFYTADWTTVNAYAWTDTPSFVEHLGGWPGTAINAVAGEEGWYSVEVPADTQKIIFNDGSNQTNDLLVTDGPYFYKNTGYATKEEAEAAMSVPEVKTTLYYYTTAWTTVYAYTWQPESLGTWPGTQATAVEGETGWYSIEVPAETVNILFNIGDDSAKTSDLLVANGPYFVGNAGYATKEEAEAAISAPVVTTYTLKGGFDNWGAGLAFEAHEEGQVKLLGVELEAGVQFKVHITDGQTEEWISALEEKVTVATNVTDDNGNENITVSETGIYDLYFKIEAKQLYIAKVVEEHEHVTEGTYVYDDNGHWVVCTCGEKVLEADHVPGAEATETEPQICTVCEKVLVPALGHEHVTEGAYEHDENGHWVVCSCEEKVLVGEHDTEGKEGACSVCGYTKPVEPEKVTVYFQNNWLWTDVKAYYWTTEGEDIVENGTWPGAAMTLVVNDGTYDIYSVEVPVNVTGLVISGIKDDGSETLDKTPDITIENKTCVMYYMVWNEKSDVEVASYHTETTETVKEADCTNAGEKKHTCSVCGNVRTEVVAAGHTFVEGVCSVCGEQESAEVEDSVVLNGLQEDVVLEVNAKTDTSDGRLVEYMFLDLVIEEETLAVFVVNGQYGNNAIAGYDSIENKDVVGEGEHGKILLAAGTYSFYFKVYNTETSGTYKYEVWVAYTHNHTYTKQSFNATEHWMQCSIEGCTAKDDTTIEAHDNAEDCTICDFVASEVVDNNVLYLTPNANWKVDNARFAAYFFGTNGDTWVSMTDSNSDGIYEVTIPEGDWTNVIFCRMNPSATDNNWTNKWNQTADLNFPMGNEVHYTVKEGTWDNGGGTWSALAE